MLWNPDVNLLVLSSVGGVSLQGMRLTKDGTVASPFLCKTIKSLKRLHGTIESGSLLPTGY